MMAALKLTVAALFLGASAFPIASYSNSDTCPLEDHAGSDRVSLLHFSTQLARKRGRKWQSGVQIKEEKGIIFGDKCASPKCLACMGKMREAVGEDGVAKFLTNEAQGLALREMDAFAQQPNGLERIDAAFGEFAPETGAEGEFFKAHGYVTGDCQEFYATKHESAPAPVSCFRKNKWNIDGAWRGKSLSHMDICKSCQCSETQGHPMNKHVAQIQEDHSARLKMTLGKKVEATFTNLFNKKVQEIQGFLDDPWQAYENLKGRRTKIALKVLKVGAGIGMAIAIAATGGPISPLVPVALLINGAFSGLQAINAKAKGASNKQVAGMLILNIVVGGISATFGIPDLTADLFLPSVAEEISGIAGESLQEAAEGLMETTSKGVTAALAKGSEAFNSADMAQAIEAAADMHQAIDAGQADGLAEGVADSPARQKVKYAFKATRGALKGVGKWLSGKAWKTIAAKEAQAKPNGDPSTVKEVLALQANLCGEAENHWAQAIVDYMKENKLEGADHPPQVDCGFASREDLEAARAPAPARETREARGRRIQEAEESKLNAEAEEAAAAMHEALSDYKRVSFGSLADFLGEEKEPLSSFVAKKPVGPPPQTWPESWGMKLGNEFGPDSDPPKSASP